MTKFVEIKGHIVLGFDKVKRETVTKKIAVLVPEDMAKEIQRSLYSITANETKHGNVKKRFPFTIDGNGFYFSNYGKPHRSKVFIPELCHPDFTQEKAEPTPQELEQERKRKERLQALPGILAQLSPKQRERIKMHFWEGLTIREIAQIEGVQCSAIHKSIQSALKAIVNKL